MTQFFYKLFPFKSFFNPSSGDFITACLVTIIILYGIFSFLWLFIRLRKIRTSINNQFTKLSEFITIAREDFETIKELFSTSPLLKDEWSEYENTLITRVSTHDDTLRVYKTEEAEAYFNEERILSRGKLNVRYWYAVPGILVGFGILGTFIGLTFGLSTFKTGTADTIQNSIEGLLSGMTTAFATSVWGIGLSIVFNAFEKRQFNKVSIAITNLNRQIDKLFTLTTQEKISFEQQDQLKQQTRAMQAFSTDLADRIKIAMDSIMASRLENLQGVVEKLYQHGEQSTALVVKEIQTSGENIASNVREAVGSAMLEKMAPALEDVAKSVNGLVPIIESLRAEKAESSVEAIREIVEEFRVSLSSTTSVELERLSKLIAEAGGGLAEFPTQLNAMMGLLQEQLQQTKTMLEQSATEAQTETQRRSEELEKVFSELLEKLQQGIGQQQKAIEQSSAKANEGAIAATAMIREEAERTSTTLEENIGNLIRLQQEQLQQTKAMLEQSTSEAQAEAQRRSEELENVFAGLLEKLQQGISQQRKTVEESATKASEEAATATAMMREEAERAATKFGETIGELQKNVAELLDRQSNNVQIVDNLIANAEDILKQGSALANSMNTTIGTVRETIGQIQTVSQQFTDSAKTLKLSGENLQYSTEEFALQNAEYLTANRETLEKMLQSQAESEKLLSVFADKFTVIENGLGGIFNQVNQGLNSYAAITRETINNYLRDFSTQLAEASKQLAGSVEALGENMEDLADTFSSVRRR